MLFAFVFPGIKSILKYLSSNVYPLSAFLPRIFLLCKPPAVVWHKMGEHFSEFCSLSHLSLPASPPLSSLSPHGLYTSTMWFPLISTEMCFVFSTQSLMFVPRSAGLGSTSTASITLLDFLFFLFFLSFSLLLFSFDFSFFQKNKKIH